jgi:hypothetical protein
MFVLWKLEGHAVAGKETLEYLQTLNKSPSFPHFALSCRPKCTNYGEPCSIPQVLVVFFLLFWWFLQVDNYDCYNKETTYSMFYWVIASCLKPFNKKEK